MSENRYNPWLHGVALLTATATLVLIFMGGLVTSHQAGMSVPDWPNSYGYNMFLFPPSIWLSNQAGGIFYEHSHRLMGTVVGMFSILLVIIAWRVESRRWVRNLAIAVLGVVIFQGVLGGLRVIWVQLNLAIVHACVAQAFFCLTAAMAVVTSRWWISAPFSDPGELPSPKLLKFAGLTVAIIYLQLIAGAMMRHYQAGLAIPDFPASYGRVLPPFTPAQLQSANSIRVFNLNLPQVTMTQIWLNFGHRIGAVLVAIALLTLITKTLMTQTEGALRRPAWLLIPLLIAQVTLGILTVLWRKPADIASFHVAVGALTLVTTFVLAVRANRLASCVTRHAIEVRIAQFVKASAISRQTSQVVPA